MSDDELEPLSEGELRALDRELDKVEDRLHSAEFGLHAANSEAEPEALKAARARGMSQTSALFWERFDGLDLGHGAAKVFALAELEARTQALFDEGRAQEGDLAIGEYGRDDLVLCVDPWAEGADVVLVDEAGQRGPYASNMARLVLGLMAELSVLLDTGGEYRDELFGEDGELEPFAERKLLRRHLDADPDAPLARFRLGQLLRRSGDARAAHKELELCLRRAPDFCWARFELGRADLDLDRPERACRNFDRAAEGAGDESLAAYFLAWAALSAPEAGRRERAAAVLARYPGFVAAQEAGAREALSDEVPGRASELLALGLAVQPTHVGLLGLKAELKKA